MVNATVNIRLEAEDKKEAEKIFATLGLTTSEAIRLFYRQTILRRGLPFSVDIPNDVTVAAMEAARRGELETGSFEELGSRISSNERRGRV